MQITFQAIAAGGEAFGRDESGRAVFAPYAAPGDVAEVDIYEERKNFARGRLLHLESASPQRVTPPCPYFLPEDFDVTNACGGCRVQHLAYEAQLEAKRAIVADALARLGGVPDPNVLPCVASPQTFGYRNKAEFFVGDNPAEDAIGFHARGTHKIIDIERCAILSEPLNELLAVLRELLARPELTAQLTVRGFAVRVGSDGALALQMDWDAVPEARKAFFLAVRERLPALIDPNQGKLTETVGDLSFRVQPFDFFQVNPSQTPQLVQIALDMAEVKPRQKVLDLFCGSGLFSLFLAKAGAKVTAVDIAGNLPANANEQGFSVQFSKAPAERYLAREAKKLAEDAPGPWELALLDPPRAGAESCIKSLARLRPARIIYVSCDPATLARDVKLLMPHGYRLTKAVPVDMFPHTAHVETVAQLDWSEVA